MNTYYFMTFTIRSVSYFWWTESFKFRIQILFNLPCIPVIILRVRNSQFAGTRRKRKMIVIIYGNLFQQVINYRHDLIMLKMAFLFYTTTVFLIIHRVLRSLIIILTTTQQQQRDSIRFCVRIVRLV